MHLLRVNSGLYDTTRIQSSPGFMSRDPKTAGDQGDRDGSYLSNRRISSTMTNGARIQSVLQFVSGIFDPS